MIVAVPREVAVKERRVALVPETVARFAKAQVAVAVQRGAGEVGRFPGRTVRRSRRDHRRRRR